jgi:hypothetical protein
MKIYRAVLKHNNGDTNEWEEVYEDISSWYSKRELAERHLPMLWEYRNWLLHQHRKADNFFCLDPMIEEATVSDLPTSMKVDPSHKCCQGEFTGFKPVPYSGKFETTKLWWDPSSLGIFICGMSIFVLIDNEEFYVHIDEYGTKTEKTGQEDSNFYTYSKEVQDKFLQKVALLVISVHQDYLSYFKQITDLEWEEAKCLECKFIELLYTKYSIQPSSMAISRLERCFDDYIEYPLITEALNRLLHLLKESNR